MADPTAKRIHELISRAMEIEHDARSAFLKQACEEIPELEAKADQLLAALLDSQSFLEEPALQLFGDEAWSTEAEPPDFVGGYAIVKKLGSGGMGDVYEAVQSQPHRTVALKIPRRRRWSLDMLRQLQRESELLGRLRHANIAQVYEAGVDESVPERPVPYFAMEYVPSARTIHQYVRDRRPPLNHILRLIRKVCEAVQHAHRLGIIHRDLKPANILIDAEGNPKIIDFGIAGFHSLDEDLNEAAASESTASLRLAGTLNYMSPEQGEPSNTIDSRTDVYSLGVVLFELLYDSLPYDLRGKSIADAVRVIRNQPPHPFANVSEKLPVDVRAVLDKALKKDRHERYSSVEAFSDDIGRFLESRPISARPATASYVFGRLVNRNRRLTTALGLLALAIIVGSAASGLFAWRASIEVSKRRVAEAEAIQQRDQAVWQSYVADMQGAFAAFQNQEAAQVRSRLAAAPVEHRNWEWDYLRGLVENNEQVVQAHEGMIFSFATSSDKMRFATGSSDGVVRVWKSENGRLAPHRAFSKSADSNAEAEPTAIIELAFRNGSSQILAGTNEGLIQVWDVDSGKLEIELAGHEAPITGLAVGADGLIASTCGKGRLKLWDGKQAESISEILDEQTEFRGVQFCDEGRRMVTWDQLGSIWLRDGQTREIIRRYRFGSPARRVCASEDGNWIAAGGRDNRVQLWNTDEADDEGRSIEIPGRRSSTDSLGFSQDNRRLAIGRIDRKIVQYSLEDFAFLGQLQGHEEYVRGVVYAPSGTRLISASGDGTLRVWNLESEGLGNIKVAASGDVILRSLSISPSGNRIAVVGSDRSIGIYDPQLKLVKKLPVKHAGDIQSVAWSPQPKTIASAGLDRSVRLWDVDSGESSVLKPPHKDAIHALAYSPDGRFLVSAGADQVLRVWDTDSREQTGEMRGHSRTVICLGFSKDGQWLASGSVDGTTLLWDWETKKLKHRLEGHGSNVFALTFDPCGRRLYTGSRDRTIRVWSTDDGKLTNILTGHGQLIRSLDIHPDGTRLVAGSWFGDVLFWDLSKHEMVTTFKGHNDVVYDLEFSPDGSYFISCSLDKSLQKFDRRPGNKKPK